MRGFPWISATIIVVSVAAACVGADPAPPAAKCRASEKSCNGACVPTDDPSVGCATASCERCPVAANAESACRAGQCASSCVAGFTDCDGDPANGCEASTSKDVANCGACGNVCGANATEVPPRCEAGKCQLTCKRGFAHCTDRDDIGCETDLASDPLSCGACGHSCLGGECVEGKCQPVKLGSLALPYGLAVDDTHVYVTSWEENYVKRMQRDGKCSPATPCPQSFVEPSDSADVTLDPRAIVSTGTDVYYGTANKMARRATAGGEIRMWGTALLLEPGYLAVAGGKVWWTNAFASLDAAPEKYLVHVRRSNLDGSGVTVIGRFHSDVDGADAGGGLAADATHIYWASLGSNGIYRAPLSVAKECTELDSCQRIQSIGGDLVAVDDQFVYWSRRIDGGGDEIHRGDKAGGGDVTLATGQGEYVKSTRGAITGIAVLGNYVYWAVGTETSRTGPGAIRRTRRDAAPCDGAECELVDTVMKPTALVAAADGLYWTDHVSNGAVYRLAK